MFNPLKICILFIVCLCLTVCSSKSNFLLNNKQCKNYYNKDYQGHYKLGTPYVIKNKKYYPRKDPDYDEIGAASWYGGRDHCKKTANGEIFDKNQLSAAHRTLPLPCVLKVTNLNNNKTVTVIANDRGPFAQNRIIDLSEKAAEIIDMKKQGTAEVRVKYLKSETNDLLRKINLAKYIHHSNSNVEIFEQQKPFYLDKNLNMDMNNVFNIIPQEMTIFVSKFNNKEQAISAIRHLSNIGGYTKLVQHYDNGKNIYEVYLKFNVFNNDTTSNFMKKVIDLGYSDAYFVN